MNIIKKVKEFTGRQYSNPRGLLGMYFGEKMVSQHMPETLWTINLLELQKGEKILELGCGAGYALKLVLEQSVVTKVVGLDVSKSVLQSAAIRNRKEIKKGRAKLVQGNVNHLDFQEESFTRVFSIQSVYFWDNLQKTIPEIYRVLESGGTLVITLSDGKSGETWDVIKNMLEQHLIPVMHQSGFKNIQILRGPRSREYHTVAIKAEK